MKYELKGNFGQIRNQLEYLNKNGIEVVMNDGVFQFENIESAYEGYKKIIDSKIEGYESYIETLKMVISTLNLYRKMVAIKDEKLVYEKYDNCLIIDGGYKGISMTKTTNQNMFPSYEIKFFRDLDSKLDRVPFYFKEDDVLYKPIKEFASTFNNFIEYDNKRIEFIYDKEGVFLVYETTTNDLMDQDTIKIDAPYKDKDLCSVDLLYAKISSRIHEGKVK